MDADEYEKIKRVTEDMRVTRTGYTRVSVINERTANEIDLNPPRGRAVHPARTEG